MKQVSLLITFCALLCMSASAQTTTIEKKEKRITITTTKVDENGKAITETWIAEGEQPEQILEQMAVNPDVMQKMSSDDQVKQENEERLFLFRSAGDNKIIEGRLSDGDPLNNNLNPLNNNLNFDKIEKVIVISDGEGNKKQKIYYHGGPAHAKVWVRGDNERNKSNCAALGVFVNYDGDNGTVITSLIEKGGAKDAGLKPGDLITKIDQYDISDYPSLHEALAHFQPGDVVKVQFVRDDKNQKAKVELRDWAQLPGHEWRARTDCGSPMKEEVIDETAQDPGVGTAGQQNIQSLELQNTRIFPNPTEGVFQLSFQTIPGPFKISITDVNGKVVYNENNDGATGSYNREIDLKGAPQGNYIISVNQGGKIYNQQISKQ
ncbi:MAG TPA: PDZ domain-containing protein [Saprospiraceae bacterium]|nr:PDZ domain-containing protein [Saprospiraceae bacterium]